MTLRKTNSSLSHTMVWRFSRRRVLPAVLALLAGLACLPGVASAHSPRARLAAADLTREASVVRTLPAVLTPAQPGTIALAVNVSATVAETSGLALAEKPPENLEPESISSSGSWDSVNKQIKWLFLPGTDIPSSLSYEVISSGNTTGTVRFHGVYDYTAGMVPLQGTIGGHTTLYATEAEPDNVLVRILPSLAYADEPTPVVINVTFAEEFSSHSGLAITENPPAGWPVDDISHGGAWDAPHHQIKWLFMPGSAIPETISYRVEHPAGSIETATFSGEFDYTVDFQPVQQVISGNTSIADNAPAGTYTDTPTNTPTFTDTPTATATPTVTNTSTPTATATDTSTPTATGSYVPPTATPSPTSTPTLTFTPTNTPIVMDPRTDVNEDGIVDQQDLLLLHRNWHRAEENN